MSYSSTNGTFAYTVTSSDESYIIDQVDLDIISSAFNRWDNMITFDSRFGTSYTVTFTINVDAMEVGVLGSAGVINISYVGDQSFGNVVPLTAAITLSSSYLPSYKTDVRNDGLTGYYHVLVHEIGHILGIGSFWDLPETPKIAYTENEETKYYYTGANALREYKSYFANSDNFVGVPMEDNGGAGTRNVHPEENGSQDAISVYDRYINGILHPGLGVELMSGWMDSSPVGIPVSRITLGFLEDMGYTVNYHHSDAYMNDLDGGTATGIKTSASCFPAGTLIQTDQGETAIEQLVPGEHTLRGKSIIAITQTRPLQKHIVCFEKDSIGKNVPSQQTLCSKEHKVLYRGEMIKARDLADMCKNVKKVSYNGETLYNVLLEKHGKMLVNNMICETLHPENIAAKFAKSKSSPSKRVVA